MKWKLFIMLKTRGSHRGAEEDAGFLGHETLRGAVAPELEPYFLSLEIVWRLLCFQIIIFEVTRKSSFSNGLKYVTVKLQLEKLTAEILLISYLELPSKSYIRKNVSNKR